MTLQPPGCYRRSAIHSASKPLGLELTTRWLREIIIRTGRGVQWTRALAWTDQSKPVRCGPSNESLGLVDLGENI